MFEIYYSKDQGLLDNCIYLFKRKYERVRHLRNLNSSELELLLLQKNLDQELEGGNLIIENYKGSFEVIKAVIPLVRGDYENILMLQLGKPEEAFIGFADNTDIEIKKLNEKTKKGYINQLLKDRYSRTLNKDMIQMVKDKVPACASSINELLESASILKKNGLLDEENLSSLLSTLRKEPNFFEFWALFLNKEKNKWLSFINDFVVCSESFNKFSYSLIFKLFEFKKFLALRKNMDDLNRIANFMKAERYVVSVFEGFLKQHGEIIYLWLDEFIIDLYFFQSWTIKSFLVNSTLLKFFLLKKRTELMRINS